ncbi:MAG TPA: YceI family protein [Ilumatobacteraceae bacterium]|nr:YceI family protein [Ilumatobacteraceae bacterium]
MSRRTKILIGAGGLGVLVAVFGVWFFLVRDDAPDAATTDAAIAALGDDTGSIPPGSAPTDGVGPAPVDGVWTVDNGVGTSDYPFDDRSYVGYRVTEELASIGTNTVVGRTPGVSGRLEIAGTKILAVDLLADFTRLESDSSGRDSTLRTQALETDTFPDATFELTGPIDLGTVPSIGETITVDAVGELTLHGVTNTITVPLEATLVGDTIAVVGRATVAFADYDIDTPTAAIVVSVDDVGELELQLFFTRAAGDVGE